MLLICKMELIAMVYIHVNKYFKFRNLRMRIYKECFEMGGKNCVYAPAAM